MVAVRKIRVTKQRRTTKLIDRPINFPKLNNLHLELLENKKKLKKNLPLIPVKPVQPPPKKEDVHQPKKEDVEEGVELVFKDEELKDEDLRNLEDDVIDNIEDKDEVGEILQDGDGESIAESILSTTQEDEILDNKGVGETSQTKVEETIDPEERERKDRDEYIWRFKILKKGNPNRKDIPEFNEHSDVQTMKTAYDNIVRDISLDENVDNYKWYMVCSWMAMEYVFTQWIGLEFTGFAKHQMTMMSSYDKLLVELGERPYNRFVLNLPVEVRILGLTAVHAAMFYIGKMVAGSNAGQIFSFFGSSPQNTSKEDIDMEPKKKMRGPSIKVADIRKMATNE